MIDFRRGAKTTGSKFYFLTGHDALWEWQILDNLIGYHVDAGYEFVIPPYLVNKQTATWAGLLPRFAGQYYQTVDGFMLIPTAETPLVGMHAGEILDEAKLPLRYVAFSPCFRREAGTYGKRDKGLRRVHQFHKIELFIICKPEDSGTLHDEMIAHVLTMLAGFHVEPRVRELSDSERSPMSEKTIDIELRAGDEWLEVSSLSNTGTNQSQLAQVRYRPKQGGKPIKVHMLNGSGVALPRLRIAMGRAE